MRAVSSCSVQPTSGAADQRACAAASVSAAACRRAATSSVGLPQPQPRVGAVEVDQPPAVGQGGVLVPRQRADEAHRTPRGPAVAQQLDQRGSRVVAGEPDVGCGRAAPRLGHVVVEADEQDVGLAAGDQDVRLAGDRPLRSARRPRCPSGWPRTGRRGRVPRPP